MKYGERTRNLLIKTIKRSLGLDTQSHGEGSPGHGTPLGFTTYDGALKVWFLRRLEGIVAMALAPDVDERTLIRWVYVEGRSVEEISETIGVSRQTIYRRMREVFNAVVEQMPYEMERSLLGLQPSNWRLKSCPRCTGGDLYRDGDEWFCFQCGHRELVVAEEPLRSRPRGKSR